MSDLLLAPYLNVTAPVTVGPWSLVPFRALKQEDDEAAAESRTWLRETLRRHPSIGEADDLAGPVASDRLKRLAYEMWRAASSAMAQRLWLTTSTLCPSGSRTNAP